MIGPKNTIDKLAISVMLDDLSELEVALIYRLTQRFYRAQKIREAVLAREAGEYLEGRVE